MSVPFKKTVFLVDAMAFRRARAESFLNPWARNESVELISLDPDEAHTRLVERAVCDMLIYSVGAPSPQEVFTEIQVLHTLRRETALAIVSDDENPATVLAAIRCGAQGYFSNSMPPDLALQALSFVLRGGTYFPPTAILASQTLNTPAPIEYRQPDLSQEQPFLGPEQQTQAPPLGPEDGLYEPQRSLFDDKAARAGGGPCGAATLPFRRQGGECVARPPLQRRAARGRVYRTAVRRSRLSLPG